MSEEQNNESTVEVTLSPKGRSILRTSLLLQGILIALVGLALTLQPVASAVAVTIVIGLFMIIHSVFMIIAATRQKDSSRNLGIIYGILILVLGIFTVINPLKMNMVWVLMVGLWELIVGINVLTAKGVSGATRFSGFLSLLVGAALVAFPMLGLFSLIWVAGIFLIISGIIMLASAFTLPKS